MSKVTEIALKYVGQKELPNNVFDPNSDFGKKLHAVGQRDGDAWCALFCEMVFKEAYPEKFKELDKLFSASAVQTYKNFTHKEKGLGYMNHALPKEGCLVIWQMYKEGVAQWQGHAGIVISVEAQPNHWIFKSVEGNTNDAGGREGVTVAIKERKVLAKVWNGLKVMGFIQI